MTSEEKDRWIALIEGVAAGGQLQRQSAVGNWVSLNRIDFDESINNYRIKPSEPRSIERFVHSSVLDEKTPIYIDNLYIKDGSDRVRVRITEILE